MKEKLVLKILDKVKFIFLLLGVDYPKMRSILNVKLIMDERRVPTMMVNETEGEGNFLFKSLLLYAIMGVFLLLFFIPPFPLFFKMNMIYAMAIFMIISALITDFSSVMLDVKEKNILLPKPVDLKTLNIAKITHIVIYLLTITLVLCGPVLIAGTIMYGLLFTLIFLVQLGFLLGFSIFLTSMLYYLILKFFDGEKLKDIINYFQIGFTIFMAVVYQFVGRAFSIIDFEVVHNPTWWSFLIPPSWFSAPFGLFIEGQLETSYVFLTITGVVGSLGLLGIYIKKVAPFFEKNLSKLNDNSRVSKKDELKSIKRRRFFSGLFCYNIEERVFYEFTLRMIAGERSLKLRLLPGLAFAVIFPLIFLFNLVYMGGSLKDIADPLRESNYHLVMYVSVLFFGTSIPILTTSENLRGSWIYRVLPIADKSKMHKGALKALMSKYIMPPFILVSSIFLWIFGMGVIVDIIIVFLATILLMIFGYRAVKGEYLFSQEVKTLKDKSTSILMISIALCGGGTLVHYLVSNIEYGLYLYLLALLIGITIIWPNDFNKKKTM